MCQSPAADVPSDASDTKSTNPPPPSSHPCPGSPGGAALAPARVLSPTTPAPERAVPEAPRGLSTPPTAAPGSHSGDPNTAAPLPPLEIPTADGKLVRPGEAVHYRIVDHQGGIRLVRGTLLDPGEVYAKAGQPMPAGFDRVAHRYARRETHRPTDYVGPDYLAGSRLYADEAELISAHLADIRLRMQKLDAERRVMVRRLRLARGERDYTPGAGTVDDARATLTGELLRVSAHLVDVRRRLQQEDRPELQKPGTLAAIDAALAQLQSAVDVWYPRVGRAMAQIPAEALALMQPELVIELAQPEPKVGPVAGVCRKCGCTDDKACPSGCAWADTTRTICTHCVGNAAAATPAPAPEGGAA